MDKWNSQYNDILERNIVYWFMCNDIKSQLSQHVNCAARKRNI